MCDFETHLFTFSLTLSFSLSPAFSTLLVFHIIIVISLNSNGKQKAKKPKLTSRQKKTNKVVYFILVSTGELLKPGELTNALVFFFPALNLCW